jgi:hypothetical protein
MTVIERCWLSLVDVDGEPACTGLRFTEPGGPPFDAGFEWVEVVRAADYQVAIDENEKLRLQVAALENDGMELAAKLGEAEEQIARLTASGRQ